MIALKIGAKIEGKLTCASMTCRIWETFMGWKTAIFFYKWNWRNLSKIKIQSNQIKEHLWYPVLLRNRWHHDHNNRNCLKQPQCYFHWIIPYKTHHLLLFWCMLCTATPNISISSKNINHAARVSILSFHFLWLWWK